MVEQLAIDLHSLFKVSAERREDHKAIQLDLELELNSILLCNGCQWDIQ